MHASKLISFAERKLKSPNKTKLIGKINVNVHNVAKIRQQNQVSERRQRERRVLGSWQAKAVQRATSTSHPLPKPKAKARAKSSVGRQSWPTCVALAFMEDGGRRMRSPEPRRTAVGPRGCCTESLPFGRRLQTDEPSSVELSLVGATQREL